MALASLVILSIFQNQFNHRKTYLLENWIFGRKCTYLFRFFFSIWEIWHFFVIEKFNGEMLIKYCAILFMSVSISVSGETKICLSFPICNDHHNESMRNRMVRKDQISNFENQWSFSAAILHNGFKKFWYSRICILTGLVEWILYWLAFICWSFFV